MAQAETRLRHCSAEIYGFAFYHLYACVQIITGLIVRTKLNNHQIVLSIKHDSRSSESVLTLQFSNLLNVKTVLLICFRKTAGRFLLKYNFLHIGLYS